MLYAPVIIPTLNRAEHLKRCLDSLAKNTGAESTELYISVDYPPAEKYVEGYSQVKDLLNQMDFSKFLKVNVYFQERNLGAKGNTEFLYNVIEQRHDRYIYTEDDNEFAPNFLEYVNKGLELFENDSKVLAICGAKDTHWETEGKNVVYSKLYAAYGAGGWLKKRSYSRATVASYILPEKIYGPGVMWKLFRRNACLFNGYVSGILCTDSGFFWSEDGSLRLCDSVYSLYMHLSDAVCIVPSIAKSRTWGNDGSGENMKRLEIDPEKRWPLDKNVTFDYCEVDKLQFIEENYSRGNQYLLENQDGETLKAVLKYCLVLLCGRDRTKVLSVIHAIKRVKCLRK